jgi:hypothetical protein
MEQGSTAVVLARWRLVQPSVLTERIRLTVLCSARMSAASPAVQLKTIVRACTRENVANKLNQVPIHVNMKQNMQSKHIENHCGNILREADQIQQGGIRRETGHKFVLHRVK